MNNQKGLTPIHIAILIGVVLFSYLAYSSKINLPQKQTSQSPTTVSDETADWKTYTNTKYGYSVMYPQELYLTEFDTGVTFTSESYPPDNPGPLDMIQITTKADYVSSEFNALFKASSGEDVPEAHHAVDVKVTKIKNLKFGNYNAVEFILDGTIPSASGLGRGPIGYEHKILIKKNDQEFIQLLNNSMSEGKTKAQDKTFDQILSTFKFK